MSRPSQRREVDKEAVAQHGVAISLACTAFGISETCYRYEAKRQAENEEIASWLVYSRPSHDLKDAKRAITAARTIANFILQGHASNIGRDINSLAGPESRRSRRQADART